MTEFFVLPAHLVAAAVSATSKKEAAELAAERDGILSGTVAVFSVDAVAFKEIRSGRTVEAVDP